MANKIVTVQDLLNLVPSGFNYSAAGMTTKQCPTKSEIEQYGDDNYLVNSNRQNNQLVTSPDVIIQQKNNTYTFKCNYTVASSPSGLASSYGITITNIQIKLINTQDNSIVYANADNIVTTGFPTGASSSRTGTINAQFQAPAGGQYRVADINAASKTTNVSASPALTSATGYFSEWSDDQWTIQGPPYYSNSTSTIITESSNSTIDVRFTFYPVLNTSPEYVAYPMTFTATGMFPNGGQYRKQGELTYLYRCVFDMQVMINGKEFGNYCFSTGNKESFDWNLYLPANNQGNRCRMIITTPTAPAGILYFFKLTLPSVIDASSAQYFNDAADDHRLHTWVTINSNNELGCIFPQSDVYESYDHPVTESDDYRITFKINDPSGTIPAEYLDLVFITKSENWAYNNG